MDAAREARLMKAIIPQRDEIQERDSLGLFHINRQAIINNLALN
jgi:hypothetical protein